jgi:hypothetical protein
MTKDWFLFLKTSNILKKILGIKLPTEAIVCHYNDLLFIDTLVFIPPSTVINVCNITKENVLRYNTLFTIYKQLRNYIDEDNLVVLTDKFYIEKYEVNKKDSINLFIRKYSFDELERIVKSISELNSKIEKYHYHNTQIDEYLKHSYGEEVALKILPVMADRKIVCTHGNFFCSTFISDKLNNLQFIQQYPEEQILLLIYISQFYYHKNDLNFTNKLVELFKKYNYKLNLLPIFVKDIKFDFIITDMMNEIIKFIWITDEEKTTVVEICNEMLQVENEKNFENCF